jgi:hypothetical protein
MSALTPKRVQPITAFTVFKEIHMNQTSNESFTLEASAVEAFADILNDEGQMHAGFVIHESNNGITADLEEISK